MESESMASSLAPAKQKARLDALLVAQGYCRNPTEARGRILAGQVLHAVTQQVLDKPGLRLASTTPIRLRGLGCPYVSRGGLKLAAALQEFAITATGQHCLDVGASTGGFTDCLLQHGAAHVVAVDVGYGQLAMSLRQDSRVTVIERCNIRHAGPGHFGVLFDIVVTDVSFIGLNLILPNLRQQVRVGGRLVLLVKPQFEVGRHLVGKGGIVRDASHRQQAVAKIKQQLLAEGCQVDGSCAAPITGATGNQEYLLAATLLAP